MVLRAFFCSLSFTAFIVCLGIGPLDAASIQENIQTIKSVDKFGKRHAEAKAAYNELSKRSAADLTTILKSFDGANPLAINWLRGAIDVIADREFKATGKLPAKELEAFTNDTSNPSEARRLAYELLVRVDATAPDRLIPKMLYDANPQFRREAVARLISKATKAKEANDAAAEKSLLKEALSGATDDDQVQAVTKPLREMGEKIDLQKHFGFLAEWDLIGPFDNSELKGFDTVYPPEKEVDLKTKYPGKMGEVEWQHFSSDDDYGKMDIAKKTAPHKGAVTYAATTFVADRTRDAEFRLMTPNAWKLWLNGELIFAREEYHRGSMFDQYRVKAKLKSGPNKILLKVCQNEQKEEWAQDWVYQFRVCDSAGVAIPSATPTTSSTK